MKAGADTSAAPIAIAALMFNLSAVFGWELLVKLGAYATEIVRAGIEAIPRGQIEAGLALNLTRVEIFRFVVLKPGVGEDALEDIRSIANSRLGKTQRVAELYAIDEMPRSHIGKLLKTELRDLVPAKPR